MSNRSTEFWLIIICFAIIYFVWGSTYVAIAFALESLPPFTLAAIRFLIAGILILSYCFFKGIIKFNSRQLKNAMWAGFLFFAIGNGLVVWGIQYVESGLTALIISLQPLNVALLLWWTKGQRPKLLSWIGLSIGIIGMLLLVGQPSYLNNIEWLLGLGAILIGMGAWAFMSVKIPELDMPSNIISSSGFQMIFGGLFLIVFSGFQGEFSQINFDISYKSIAALLYLIIFGSIIAFTAFNYLLSKVSPTQVATAAYVNPVVALFLGWWLNDEILSFQSILASCFLIGGVVLINLAKRRK